METWLTSDLHLGHENIIKYCDRPFQDVREMDGVIIDHWNTMVGPRDMVYVIGDVSFHSSERTVELVRSLNGYKVLLKGNHDLRRTDTFWLRAGFDSVLDQTIIKSRNGVDIELSHYPFWGGYTPATKILFHGHSHNQFKGKIHIANGRSLLNFSVECWDYKPVHIEQAFTTVEQMNHQLEADGKVIFKIGDL